MWACESGLVSVQSALNTKPSPDMLACVSKQLHGYAEEMKKEVIHLVETE